MRTRLAGLARHRALLTVGLPLALAGGTLDACFAFFLLAIQAYMPDTMHASPAAPGYALGMYGATRVLLQGPGGLLARRIGPGRLLVLGMTGGAAALLGLWQAESLEQVYTLVLVYGAATALAWPALYLRVGDLVPDDRGTLFGLITMGSLGGTGAGLGLGALVVDLLPPRDLILGAGVALTLGALGTATMIRFSRRRPTRPRPAPALRAVTKRRQEVRLDLLARLCATLAMQGLGLSMMLPLLRQYVHDQLDLEMHQLIVVAAPAGLVGGLALLPLGRLADRVSRGAVIAAGALLAGGGTALMEQAHTRVIFALAMIPLAAGYAACAPALGAWIADLTDETGGNVGLALTVQGAAVAVGPILVGFLLDDGGGIGLPMLLAAGAWFLTAACALIPLGARTPSWRAEA